MRRSLLLLAIFALPLGGCGRKHEQSVDVVMLGGAPAVARALHGATVEGLVAADAEGRIGPALADRWIVTDDGQSYIFRLRDGTWADGSALTSETARAALRQALATVHGTPLEAELDAIEDVRAMASRVLEIRLTRPVPDLLQILARPEFGLAKRGVGAGPLALKRRSGQLVLMPIAPEQRGLPAIKAWTKLVRVINLSAAPADKAVASFEAGGADVVVGGTYNEWPAVLATSPPRTAIEVDRVVGLFGLVPVHYDGFLGDPARREAIAMAIDRAALADALRQPDWTPTTRIVTPGTDGDAGLVGERWTTLSLAQRRAMATSRVARWHGHHGSEVLRVAGPVGAGADLVFARITADLGAIGLVVQRVAPGAAADLRLIDEVADYARPDWFLTRLSCRAQPQACSPAADAQLAAARAVPDTAARNQALASAEEQLAADNVFIPFGPPLRWMLVGPGVTGIAANQLGLHPLAPLALPSAK